MNLLTWLLAAASVLGPGLVDVQTLSPTIRVELKYSGTDNFLKADLYGDLERCYLQEPVARMLSAAQAELVKRKPGWSLLVYDCARPASVQQRMWDRVKGTPHSRYVAPPKVGSNHTYGAAVDLTLADANTKPVDMGTLFDSFTELAQPRYEARFLGSGELSKAQHQNRLLLRTVMRSAGFRGILSEWWHFNAFDHDTVRKRFSPIE